MYICETLSRVDGLKAFSRLTMLYFADEFTASTNYCGEVVTYGIPVIPTPSCVRSVVEAHTSNSRKRAGSPKEGKVEISRFLSRSATINPINYQNEPSGGFLVYHDRLYFHTKESEIEGMNHAFSRRHKCKTAEYGQENTAVWPARPSYRLLSAVVVVEFHAPQRKQGN